MSVEVRRATVADAEGIARVHLLTWQAAYRHVFPPDELDALPIEPRIRGWSEGLANPEVDCFVVGDPICGFAALARSEDQPELGELEAIYVDPSEWGAGAGPALLSAGEDALRARGFEEALLWVLEDNPRARRFYESAGWEHDGGRKTWPRMGVEPYVVRYRKRLSGS